MRIIPQYDFKAFLDAGADTVAESQEQTAREMYRLLSSIPLDHLAANGESMVSQERPCTVISQLKVNHLMIYSEEKSCGSSWLFSIARERRIN